MYTKKLYFDAKNHLPFSVLRCDQYPLRRKRKRAKNRRFTHVLARDATGIDRIANGELEVIFRIEIQLFCIHHFGV